VKCFTWNKQFGWNEVIQLLIFWILVITAVYVYGNLKGINRQIVQTQVLNRPLCGIKSVEVVPKYHEKAHLIKISIMNWGNSVAKNVFSNGGFYSVECVEKPSGGLKMIPETRKVRRKLRISEVALMPQQETIIFMYFDRDTFNNIVIGKNKLMVLEAIINYTVKDNEREMYYCRWPITRMLTGAEVFETYMDKSEIKLVDKNSL